MTPLPLTVISLTINEGFHLPGVIESVDGWASEYFIVDSLSTDQTVDIALEGGAKVVQRPFTDVGNQWNISLDRLPIKTPWTLSSSIRTSGCRTNSSTVSRRRSQGTPTGQTLAALP